MVFNALNDLYTIGKVLGQFGPAGALASILGAPESWFGGRYPELSLFENLDTGAQTLANLVVQRTFPLRESPSSIVQDRDEKYASESWFFVNGITTNLPMLKLNGEYLRELFQRPFELVYNPTDGILVDLVECLLGRTFDAASEPCDYLTDRIADSLNYHGYDRVILLCHSQGGIITSNVVEKILRNFMGTPELKKLEVYTFGCAADEMDVDELMSIAEGRLVPYIEHYVNLGDLVANVGVLQKRKLQGRGSQVDYYGEIYELDRSGHYLNAHYLPELKNQSYNSRRFGKQSRLYTYLDGGRPGLEPKDYNALPEQIELDY